MRAKEKHSSLSSRNFNEGGEKYLIRLRPAQEIRGNQGRP